MYAERSEEFTERGRPLCRLAIATLRGRRSHRHDARDRAERSCGGVACRGERLLEVASRLSGKCERESVFCKKNRRAACCRNRTVAAGRDDVYACERADTERY